MTKERPILFNDEMVRAILDGRKTQTRRIVKHRPDTFFGDDPCRHSWPAKWRGSICSDCWAKWLEGCPWSVGDRLWVREAWAEAGTHVRYRATDAINELRRVRPSIHMPRWASRITLEITGVRVERVQDISEEDARAEGLVGDSQFDALLAVAGVTLRECFGTLWDSLLGEKPGQSWADNPWVWVISFKRVSS